MSEGTDRRALLRIGGAALGAAAAAASWGPSPAAAAAVDPQDVVTPQQFGAVADGQHDDTDAIQQAINAQQTRLNRIVVFPPGTYRITRTIVIPDLPGEPFNRIQLRGDSTMTNRASIIQVTHDGVGIDVRCSLAAIYGLAFVAPAKTAGNVPRRRDGRRDHTASMRRPSRPPGAGKSMPRPASMSTTPRRSSGQPQSQPQPSQQQPSSPGQQEPQLLQLPQQS
ncbi:glycoside hydrolase family 55 protein [Nonomuraea sp. NBC_00507]|uniref:glycosyl hydrolase family 28-related protein n=1 Tax=Nonomuraea sp. NBC_00507 TaxID=2976002 RepID=UPI002E171E47